MAKTKKGLSKSLVNIVLTVFSLVKFIPHLVSLIEEETCLAGRSLISLLILYVIAGALLTCTWLGILALCFFYLTSLQLSSMMSLFILIVFNLLLMMIVLLIMLRKKNNLLFAKTRNLIRKV